MTMRNAQNPPGGRQSRGRSSLAACLSTNFFSLDFPFPSSFITISLQTLTTGQTQTQDAELRRPVYQLVHVLLFFI